LEGKDGGESHDMHPITNDFGWWCPHRDWGPIVNGFGRWCPHPLPPMSTTPADMKTSVSH
jgi:hypothetical protein